ncbi:hypothetical protein BJ742DRAFT_816777 [Cladochytrium replicatum]|nr:hypothetical protein BJ742DRAFT_816777 [Cladochytrium replicatum]
MSQANLDQEKETEKAAIDGVDKLADGKVQENQGDDELVAAPAQLAPQPVLVQTVQDEFSLALLKRITKAFDTFDANNIHACDAREVGTIIRSLGVYPSEEQLKAWIKEMEPDEPNGYIMFERFSKVALRILTSNSTGRDDEEKLYRAFRTLDGERKGYLLPGELREALMNEGEQFSKEEMEEMIMACTDPTEGKIYYEDYVTILAQ